LWIGVQNRRYMLLGTTAKFRAAAVHGIMTMTRGKGRYALTASVYANVYVKIAAVWIARWEKFASLCPVRTRATARFRELELSPNR
jgi:hypothetical protein